MSIMEYMFRYKSLLIIFALLLVAGCSSSSGTNFFSFGGGSSDFEEENPFEGKKGLELSFLEGAPPEEVYPDTTFDIILDVHNEGALDVERGVLTLNIPSFIFEVDSFTKQLPLIRGKESFASGQIEQVSWEGIGVKRESSRTDNTQRINVNLCYEGSVIVQPIVCVKPRPGNPGILEGECDVGKQSVSSSGYGGPITVSAITETVIKETDSQNKIKFRFEVQNVGGGDVIDKDRVNGCSLTERDKSIAEVEVEEVSWGGESFSCKGGKDLSGKVVLVNGKGTFECESPLVRGDQHYSLPLYIKMNYGYVKGINKGFTLKKDAFFA